MNILVLGSGGREHAFATQLAKSPQCDALFVAPGNAGTRELATNLPIAVTDFNAIKEAVLQHAIDMVVVGPEDPLVQGIYDFFKADQDLNKVMVIGPSAQGAELEGSKERAKEFMAAHQIPTAAYQSFTAKTLAQGKAFLATMNPPYVLKADGLAAGKGVLILDNLLEAQQELELMLAKAKFGKASEKVVVEAFLSGIELSVFVLTDGTSYKVLPTAKDYKRIGEADQGLNTGGMGAISPVPFADQAFMEKIETRIVKPTVDGLKKEGIIYEGFVFIGLIKVGDDPFVIEYNVRMGDPETEAVLPRIKTDLVTLLAATAQKTLSAVTLEIDERAAATIMAVSGGYPEAYEKGKVIDGLSQNQEALVFHAGTTDDGPNVVTNGGRVLAVTSLDKDFREAIKKSYQTLEQISFDKMYFRRDIGFDL
ncbi:MAG: phosphoribosylamine--glycine ligase [Cryomorphaceae bacterium BACL21 MAG-121220-bin10]|jgi:phosphoribosylamine---glycine ligase|nr:MAG: phosphoribosylamine--glycine ligase [Cryomorphaceae bacterium BACL21 MAG-121220-bin10]MDB9782901.1 phosphoribosylamine--glycine ligase [Winogradskyella sp.]|tara:strand:+ start:38536 stop:39807 length:1272 start_codon:yes stop_codon:yes gene_type:complete